MLVVILCKKIPKIGGNIQAALVITGALALILGGVSSPSAWLAAFIDGLDRLAWVIFLSIIGSIYAETQTKLGVIETIMGALKARFGNRPRALVVCIMLVLVLAGSLLGDAVAASTVIGVLTIGSLAAMGMEPELICCIIVMGASLGSIMPPITQAMALSSSLVGADVDSVLRYGYITVPIVIVFTCLYVTLILMRKNRMNYNNTAALMTDGYVEEEDKFAGMKPRQILASNKRGLIPLILLIIIIFFRTITNETLHFDLGPELLSKITHTAADGTVTDLYTWMSQVTILKGLTNGIVLSLLIVTIIAFCFKEVRSDIKGTIRIGMSKVKTTVGIQVSAAFMLGSFYAGGQIDQVTLFTQGLNANVLRWGGAIAMALVGMLTGSQSTAQNVVFSFFGPALVQTGVSKTFAAVAGAHLAASGQGLPPADITTFVVAGIVGGMLAKKVNPVKSMIYMVPMCLALFAVGMVFLYI